MLNNEQKQTILSGILGDGSLYSSGYMQFSCIHKEYMEMKNTFLGNLSGEVLLKDNKGYKADGKIYRLTTQKSRDLWKFDKYSIQDVVNELDELGIALWLGDDGSRHRTANFYNINTHALTEDVQRNVLIPFFHKFNIFPQILKEVKKDGRVFHYLYVSKWKGAMELSRMFRKLNLKCYDYKLMPIELEEAYFTLKDTEEFKNGTTRKRTDLVKKFLNIHYHEHVNVSTSGVDMVKLDSSTLID